MTRVLVFPVVPVPSERARMALACAVLRAEVVRLMAEGIDVGVWAEGLRE